MVAVKFANNLNRAVQDIDGMTVTFKFALHVENTLCNDVSNIFVCFLLTSFSMSRDDPEE
jgi:hypothetical protein